MLLMAVFTSRKLTKAILMTAANCSSLQLMGSPMPYFAITRNENDERGREGSEESTWPMSKKESY